MRVPTRLELASYFRVGVRIMTVLWVPVRVPSPLRL